MRWPRLPAVLLAACASAERAPPLPDEVKEQEKGLTVERTATTPTDRTTYELTEAEAKDFDGVWELFRRRSPGWPRARDRFVARSSGAGYLMAGHLLRYYMRVNMKREYAREDLVRARNEIIAVGEPCVPALVDLMILDEIRLPNGDTYITDDITRRDCIFMLGRIGEPSVPQLLETLDREDLGAKGRRFIALTLGETRSPRAYDPLVRLLRTDPSWQVRADAAEALGALGDPRAIVPLNEAVRKDKDTAVIRRAGKARTRLRGRR